MKWPRISILGLIAAVVACGVVFAVLWGGSDYWLSAAYTMTVAMLLGAVVLARYRRGPSRAFWFGFAVFGWGMFLLGTNPWTSHLNRNLLTTRLIQLVVVRIRMGTNDLEAIDDITRNTVGIVHLLVVLAIGAIGGLFAVAMRKRSRRTATADPSRRSNVVPKLTILLGLSLAGLGTFDRPAPADFPTYFADAANHPDGFNSPSRVEWYSKHLQQAGEPSLWLLLRRDREATVFRFLWLPTFHHPVCVRIERKTNGVTLRAVVLDGLGGYDPGHVAIDETVQLDEAQWRGLERYLEAASFWKIPTKDPDEESGSDGDQCIIEGVRDGVYHVVDRWDPNPAYTSLCRAMLDLTGLKTRKTWEEYHPNEPAPSDAN